MLNKSVFELSSRKISNFSFKIVKFMYYFQELANVPASSWFEKKPFSLGLNKIK